MMPSPIVKLLQSFFLKEKSNEKKRYTEPIYIQNTPFLLRHKLITVFNPTVIDSANESSLVILRFPTRNVFDLSLVFCFQ